MRMEYILNGKSYLCFFSFLQCEGLVFKTSRHRCGMYGWSVQALSVRSRAVLLIHHTIVGDSCTCEVRLGLCVLTCARGLFQRARSARSTLRNHQWRIIDLSPVFFLLLVRVIQLSFLPFFLAGCASQQSSCSGRCCVFFPRISI